MIVHPPRHRQFSREEYYAMDEMGWFGDQRVELIEGEIIEMSPASSHHVRMIMTLTQILAQRVPKGYTLSVQNSMGLGVRSDPLPDISIVKGKPLDYEDALPSRAELVIEVSESSLAFDRKKKASLFAKYGVADYWIVNLVDRVVEVYRKPEERPNWYFGYHYAMSETYNADDVLVPLNFPKLKIGVSELWE